MSIWASAEHEGDESPWDFVLYSRVRLHELIDAVEAVE